MSTVPEDASTRAVVLDPRRSFIVQAPAGSGKTGLLIQRYLALLPTVDEPEQIVAMTFTRKAAGEMRQRVLAALAAAATGAPSVSEHEQVTSRLASAALDHDRTRGWDLLEHPHRIHARTVDAFCASVVRAHPIASGLGGRVEVTDDARPLFEAAVDAVVRRGSAALEVVLWHLDNDVALLRTLLVGLLQRRDQWIRQIPSERGTQRLARWREQLESALVHETEQHLRRVQDLAPPRLVDRGPNLLRHAARNLGEELPVGGEFGSTCEHRVFWERCASLLLTQKGDARAVLSKRDGFPPTSPTDRLLKAEALELIQELASEHPDFLRALDDVRRLPPVAFDDVQWPVIEALIGLFEELLSELRSEFARDRRVDHPEIAAAALRALARLRLPLRHLLVDEFQDTSTSQYRLVEKLIDDWRDGDGRTLFLVGDPMQSIYRFREAEVGLYLRCRTLGIGSLRPIPERLRVNFRSTAPVTEEINRVFGSVMPSTEDPETGAVPYEPFRAQALGRAGDGVTYHAWCGPDELAEAQRCVEIIANAQARAAPRVALLGAYRQHLHPTLRRLRELGIRYRAVELEGLSGRPVIQDLLAVTSMFVAPGERLAWLIVLRGPMGGLGLDDLHALVAGEARALPELLADEGRLARLSESGRAGARRVFAAWHRFYTRRQRRPLRRAVEGLWLSLAGPAFGDARDLEEAALYFDLLGQVERGGDLPSRGLLESRLSGFFAPPDPLATDDLQVMTIHRAKGLEFDVVLVPGLGKARRRDDPSLVLWQERFAADTGEPVRLLLAPVRSARTAERDPIYDFMARQERVRADLEAVRLLYVACTRARSRLHLLGHLQQDADGEWRAPPESLLAVLGPAVVDRCRERALPSTGVLATDGAGAVTCDESVDRAGPVQVRVRSDAVLPSPAADVGFVPGWATRPEVARSEAAEREREPLKAQAVGIVTHRLLESVATEGPESWSEERLRSVMPGVRFALEGEGLATSEATHGARDVVAMVTAMLVCARGRWILAPHPEAACEREIAGELAGEWWVGRVDRTFVVDGERWVIDYKTSPGPAPGTPEHSRWLDDELSQHAQQLGKYRTLWTAVEPGRRVRVALYLLRTGTLVELPDTTPPGASG
ncbi:MAG: UvrD-helicase domain-containing protein [Planctomycetota bacterium]